MATVLDFSEDHGRLELYRLAKLYDFPEYVKHASAVELDGAPDMPSAAFGDDRRRKFAGGTRASCWLSWLSFLENGEQLPRADRDRIEARLSKFATALAIMADVTRLKEAHARHNSKSLDDLPDSVFAIVRLFEDGDKERAYPLRNPLEIKRAAEWLAEHRDALSVGDRRTIANKIIERADETGTDLSAVETTIEKLAGLGTGPATTVAEAIQGRIRRLRTVEDRESRETVAGLQKLAAVFATGDSPENADPALRAKVAEILDQVDAAYQFKRAYQVGDLLRPEDAVYPHSVREIDDFRTSLCTLPNGAVYDKRDFAKLSTAAIRGVFGDDFAEEVHGGLGVDPDKLAEAAQALPRPDLQKLANLLDHAGVRPTMAARPDDPGLFDDLRVHGSH